MHGTYKKSQTWFDQSEIRTRVGQFLKPHLRNTILEIGCFEGISSCFFSDNFLSHPESSLDCVDPFFVSGTVKDITTLHVNEHTREVFRSNLLLSKNPHKITHHATTSDEFFKANKTKYSFIYLDGNHEPRYIERDISNSFKHIQMGGIIWMDDYGEKYGPDSTPLASVFDKTLASITRHTHFSLIHRGYQLAIQVW